MKTIGLLGGMSWESTQLYYAHLNRFAMATFGGHTTPEIIIISVDFEALAQMQRDGDWSGAAALLAERAQKLEAAGAELVALCTNTMHKIAGEISSAISVPFVHVCDAVVEEANTHDCRTLGLLGTRFTMEDGFYAKQLENHGISVLIPEKQERTALHRIIYEELCQGKILKDSTHALVETIRGLQTKGAKAVILGCTEIAMLINSDNSPLPVLDTTRLHSYAIFQHACRE